MSPIKIDIGCVLWVIIDFLMSFNRVLSKSLYSGPIKQAHTSSVFTGLVKHKFHFFSFQGNSSFANGDWLFSTDDNAGAVGVVELQFGNIRKVYWVCPSSTLKYLGKLPIIPIIVNQLSGNDSLNCCLNNSGTRVLITPLTNLLRHSNIFNVIANSHSFMIGYSFFSWASGSFFFFSRLYFFIFFIASFKNHDTSINISRQTKLTSTLIQNSTSRKFESFITKSTLEVVVSILGVVVVSN
jgi:hypothetical protein